MTKQPSGLSALTRHLLGLFTDEDLVDSVVEDMEDRYVGNVEQKGYFYAQSIWIGKLIIVLTSFFIKSFFWRLFMFGNYLKITLRNIKKHKGYSFLNISGLAVGMACAILILLWVQDELSYDRFHPYYKNTYRTLIELIKDLQPETYSSHTGPGIASQLKQEFPEIVYATRFSSRFEKNVSYNQRAFNEEGFGFADPDFFNIFAFPLLQGQKETALSNPFSIVITEDLAKKFFGSEDPMGKTLRLEGQFDFLVTGVLKNIPSNTHLRFNILVPFQHTQDLIPEYGKNAESLHFHFYRNYVTLREGTSLDQMNEKIREFLKRGDSGSPYNLWLQPIEKIHLHSRGIRDVESRSDIRTVSIMSAIAVFILIIACVNFMNLTTARSERRAREIGLRKVVGAKKMELMGQFLGESLVFSFIALFVALGLALLLMPIFNNITHKQLSLFPSGTLILMGELLLFGLATGFVSGSYPALFLSSLHPVNIMRGTTKPGKGKMIFRRTLVVLQFAISIFLIISTFIVSKQFYFMRDKDLGYTKENVVYIGLKGSLGQHLDVVRSEMQKNPNVLGVTLTSSLLTRGARATGDFHWEGKDPEQENRFGFVSVDYDFIKALNISLAGGRNFPEKFPEQPFREFLINETAAKIIDTELPVGKRAGFSRDNPEGTILGVVKDYHFMSLQNPIRPLILYVFPSQFQYILVRIGPQNVFQTLRFLESVCQQIEPSFQFECQFLDDALQSLYRSEGEMRQAFGSFTSLAILISCLGLVGLASYMVEMRRKEIGIRKVLGAKAVGLLNLIFREFALLVVFSSLLAWPAAYLAMNKWLQNFAFRTNVNLWTFLLATSAALIIALFTVSYHARRAAVVDPVAALKHE